MMNWQNRLKRWITIGVGFLVAAALLAACQPAPETKAHVSGSETVEERAARIVAAMSPEDKAGQVMMVGLMNEELQPEDLRQLAICRAGNVILFDRNMQSPAQVRALSGEVKQTIERQCGIAPFIAVDQEGGQVLRMREQFLPVPSQEEIGRSGSPGKARQWAADTGRELKSMGINVNFAPVVDLGSSAERSYGSDPEMVSAYAVQACQGYAEAGIWCALKHFPGIGKVQTDPHMDGDSVAASKDELMQQDLKPFAAIIRQIPADAMFVMVSNVTFPSLDAEYPACVSQTVMTDLLRETYGYKGLIVSDDMEMGAMAKHYAFSDMGVMALKAGADMVLVCHDYGHEQETHDGIVREYKANPEFHQMVDEKVMHIVETKLKMNYL
ncbi:beta-N-acetylhexosaminidase [Megasphaera sp. SW808]|nr:beta-N-acetylhexosaminidase [Megasphaera sp. SW808]